MQFKTTTVVFSVYHISRSAHEIKILALPARTPDRENGGFLPMPQANSVCFGCLVDAFEFLAMGARPGRWSILLAHARVGDISPAAVIPSTDARRHGNLRRSIVAFSSEVD